jgi:HK97 family phage major capsid protein
VGWVGERESRTATATGELNVLKIPVNELYAMPSVTQKMIDDGSINIEAWHAQKVARDLGLAENTAFITGNGINRPRGIATYSNGSTYGTVAQVSLGGSAAITVDGLMDLQGALYEQYQPQAWFAMRRATRTYIRKLVDGEGRYLWSLDGGAVQGVQEMLLGQPVKLMADVAAIAASSLSVIYGDFKGYLIVDRIGIRVLRDPYSTKGSVLLYTTKRVGGGMRDFDAIKIGICA